MLPQQHPAAFFNLRHARFKPCPAGDARDQRRGQRSRYPCGKLQHGVQTEPPVFGNAAAFQQLPGYHGLHALLNALHGNLVRKARGGREAKGVAGIRLAQQLKRQPSRSVDRLLPAGRLLHLKLCRNRQDGCGKPSLRQRNFAVDQPLSHRAADQCVKSRYACLYLHVPSSRLFAITCLCMGRHTRTRKKIMILKNFFVGS